MRSIRFEVFDKGTEIRLRFFGEGGELVADRALDRAEVSRLATAVKAGYRAAATIRGTRSSVRRSE